MLRHQVNESSSQELVFFARRGTAQGQNVDEASSHTIQMALALLDMVSLVPPALGCPLRLLYTANFFCHTVALYSAITKIVLIRRCSNANSTTPFWPS